jgi:hypothetical protein
MIPDRPFLESGDGISDGIASIRDWFDVQRLFFASTNGRMSARESRALTQNATAPATMPGLFVIAMTLQLADAPRRSSMNFTPKFEPPNSPLVPVPNCIEFT